MPERVIKLIEYAFTETERKIPVVNLCFYLSKAKLRFAVRAPYRGGFFKQPAKPVVMIWDMINIKE